MILRFAIIPTLERHSNLFPLLLRIKSTHQYVCAGGRRTLRFPTAMGHIPIYSFDRITTILIEQYESSSMFLNH
jgi:hypothetical protein